MSFIKERVAYLKGLMEGMKYDDSTPDGKLIKAIVDVLDDFAYAIEDIDEFQKDLSDQVSAIDDDVIKIGDRVLTDEDELSDECDMCSAEVECPHCLETFDVTDDMIDDENDTIECPKCGENIDIEWDCDCGCGCEGHDDHEEK